MLQGISYKDFETVAEGSTGGKKYCAKQVDGLLWVEGEKRCVEGRFEKRFRVLLISHSPMLIFI